MFKSKDNQLIVINSSRSFANELAHKEHISGFGRFALAEIRP
jgi:hypothetical protein